MYGLVEYIYSSISNCPICLKEYKKIKKERNEHRQVYLPFRFEHAGSN